MIKLEHLVVNGNQEFFVVNKMPDFKYRRDGKYLVAECDGFRSCFQEYNDYHAKAFAGREFDIDLEDGSTIRARGQYWDCVHPSWENVVSVGANTIESLRGCYVFCGFYLDKEKIDTFKLLNPQPFEYFEFGNLIRPNNLFIHQFKETFKKELGWRDDDFIYSNKIDSLFDHPKTQFAWTIYLTSKLDSQNQIDKYKRKCERLLKFVDSIYEMPTSQADIDDMDEENYDEHPDFGATYTDFDFRERYEEIVAQAAEAYKEAVKAE